MGKIHKITMMIKVLHVIPMEKFSNVKMIIIIQTNIYTMGCIKTVRMIQSHCVPMFYMIFIHSLVQIKCLKSFILIVNNLIQGQFCAVLAPFHKLRQAVNGHGEFSLFSVDASDVLLTSGY